MYHPTFNIPVNNQPSDFNLAWVLYSPAERQTAFEGWLFLLCQDLKCEQPTERVTCQTHSPDLPAFCQGQTEAWVWVWRVAGRVILWLTVKPHWEGHSTGKAQSYWSGLQHLSYNDWGREVGLSSLERRRLQSSSLQPFKYIEGAFQKMRDVHRQTQEKEGMFFN